MISRSPLFNLQAVLRETNLKPDVLRAWERRYGLPRPERTAGGHRLYSEYDIATIKWLRTRQDEGLSISRAVELWNEISNSGRDPLAGEITLSGIETQPGEVEANRVEILQSNWLSACLAFDALQAEGLINQAFALYPVETVCFDILQKGISEIGQLWYEGKASVQQEHFATALAERRIETLISMMPQPTRGRTILAGCPEGETHSLPVLLLTLLLRRKGFNVVYLGASIPLDQMEQTAAAIQPDLIVLAAQQLPSAASLRSAAILFKKSGLPMAYGGMIFHRVPEIYGRIPGFYLGDGLEEAVDRIDSLLESPTPYPNIVTVGEHYAQTAVLFREKLPKIEAALLDLLKEEKPIYEAARKINSTFATEIIAALELGECRFMEPDLEWLKKYLANIGVPVKMLPPYLSAYRQAVRQELGEPGKLITDWLDVYLTAN